MNTTILPKCELITPRPGWAFLLIATLLACFAFVPKARPVSPPPDGGYGGGNTAEGTDPLFNLTTGVWNSAIGFRALYNNTTGIRNTAVGYKALYTNNAQDNVAIGPNALFKNTTGSRNIAIGSFALQDNITGSDNIAIGNRALWHVTGSGNTQIGDSFLSTPETLLIGRPPAPNPHCEPGFPTVQASIYASEDVYVGSAFSCPPPQRNASI